MPVYEIRNTFTSCLDQWLADHGLTMSALYHNQLIVAAERLGEHLHEKGLRGIEVHLAQEGPFQDRRWVLEVKMTREAHMMQIAVPGEFEGVEVRVPSEYLEPSPSPTKRPQLLMIPAENIGLADAWRLEKALTKWQEHGGPLVMTFPAKVYECRDGAWTLLPEGPVETAKPFEWDATRRDPPGKIRVEVRDDQFYTHIGCTGEIEMVGDTFRCMRCLQEAVEIEVTAK